MDFPAAGKESKRYQRLEKDISVCEMADSYLADDEGYGSLVDDLINEEKMRYDEQDPHQENLGIATALDDVPECRGMIFKALMWKMRIQSAVFEVFMTLCDSCCIDLSGLQHRINFNMDEQVAAMTRALNAFEIGRKFDMAQQVQIDFSFYMPLQWQACLIVRGCIVENLDTIFEFIAQKGAFGSLDYDRFRKWWPEGTKIQKDPLCMSQAPKLPGHVGVHLPMGLATPIDINEVYGTIDIPLKRYEDLFAKYFRIPRDSFVPAGDIVLC